MRRLPLKEFVCPPPTRCVADLLAAREAVSTIAHFFSLVGARAFRRGEGLFDVIRELEEML